MKKEMGKSEFGKGFIYSLVNFAKHFDKAFENSVRSGLSKNEALSLWINGASDHLYEVEYPPKLPESIKKQVEKLRNNALDYGHGDKMMVGMPEKEYSNIREALNDITLSIDKWLGVKTEEARWD